ncbi:SDR family oxidoreductase [Croceicoccus sp. BE223]|uniref:SDR family oxidoreductase n=1 Tax=Croceicoccus sp. BE223 TaxID=2817716 RepID=UPI002866F684|nr:SDR family oxidoreductase [Croceicoccus sp. BE223]MDR7103800.1 NAD(P)-dependent dehydrogenase (short-subunit alcohol dehydrogenase family) [Croceicoccus sp. BE223]
MARIIVAGGFGILGQAVAKRLAASGHAVAVIDMANAPAGYDGIAQSGVDLADEGAVASAYADVVGRLGGLDGVVNVAGGFAWETVADGSLDTWDRMYRINLRTTVTSCRVALAHLGKGGAIVNVGAAAAARADAGMGAYAASKAGVATLTQALAAENADRAIRVNAVLPTTLDTPANRKDMPDADFSTWVSPNAAADAIAFLLSDAARAVTGEGVRLSLGG